MADKASRYSLMLEYLVVQGLSPADATAVMSDHLDACPADKEAVLWLQRRPHHFMLGTEMSAVRARALAFIDANRPNHPRRAWFTQHGPRGIDSSKERT